MYPLEVVSLLATAGESRMQNMGILIIANPLLVPVNCANMNDRASSNPADLVRNSNPADLVRNLLASLKGGSQGLGGGQSQGKTYPMLTDLLDTSTTLPMVDNCPDKVVDSLVSYLPPTVVVLAQQGENGDSFSKEPSPADAAAAQEAMTYAQKRALLKKVLRSPQFHQSLDSLSLALREGGLPSIAEALGIEVENGGVVRGGAVPLGGGEAVEAFVNGFKKKVQGSE